MCTLRLNYVHTFTSISQNFTRSAKYTAWIIEQPPKIWQPQPLFLNFKAPIPHLTIVVIFRKPPIHIAWCAVSHVDTEPRLIPSRKARNTINIKITRKKLTIITWENSAHHEAWQEKLLLLVYHFVRFFFSCSPPPLPPWSFFAFLTFGLEFGRRGQILGRVRLLRCVVVVFVASWTLQKRTEEVPPRKKKLTVKRSFFPFFVETHFTARNFHSLTHFHETSLGGYLLVE